MECSDIRTRIETGLDPGGIIKQDVEAGVPQQQGVRAYAEETVQLLDEAFRDDGGAGITVDEMEAYVQWLVDEEQG